MMTTTSTTTKSTATTAMNTTDLIVTARHIISTTGETIHQASMAYLLAQAELGLLSHRNREILTRWSVLGYAPATAALGALANRPADDDFLASLMAA